MNQALVYCVEGYIFARGVELAYKGARKGRKGGMGVVWMAVVCFVLLRLILLRYCHEDEVER